MAAEDNLEVSKSRVSRVSQKSQGGQRTSQGGQRASGASGTRAVNENSTVVIGEKQETPMLKKLTLNTPKSLIPEASEKSERKKVLVSKIGTNLLGKTGLKAKTAQFEDNGEVQSPSKIKKSKTTASRGAKGSSSKEDKEQK